MSGAKKYAAIKYTLALVETAYLFVLLFVFCLSGSSGWLAQKIHAAIPAKHPAIAVFFAAIYGLYAILDFPLHFYGSFVIERKFSLSAQKFGSWLIDQIKAGVLAFVISLILLEAFYYILDTHAHIWWILISAFWIFVSIVLAKLTPLVIIPLFFRYKKLERQSLRERIVGLAERMQVKIIDVFEIDFSRKTLKANAGFVGVGKTRRVVLADTLKERYTDDEIEVILAHEFAHYRLGHLMKMIFLNSAFILLSFFVIYKTSVPVLGWFGYGSLADIAAMPVVFMYLVIFGLITQPFQNYVSRCFERDADALALKVTGLRDAFISLMNKLASQNLSDRTPHLVIKFFFFDHPPIDERIKSAG